MKTQNTLIGRSSGSIGGVTASTWKGINVMKSKAENVANPNTIGQQNQRKKFGKVVQLYRSLAALIAVGFSQLAIAKSAYNAFASENLKNGSVTSVDGTIISDFSKFEVGKGSLSKTNIIGTDMAAGNGSMTVEYDSASTVDKQPNDKAYCAILNTAGDVVGTSMGNFDRISGELTVDFVNGANVNGALKVYLFFYQPATRKVSDSTYTNA